MAKYHGALEAMDGLRNGFQWKSFNEHFRRNSLSPSKGPSRTESSNSSNVRRITSESARLRELNSASFPERESANIVPLIKHLNTI